MLCPELETFNVDLISPYILRTNGNGMFGFSVSIHEGIDGKYLLVGAPKAQTQQPGVDNGGAVYKCKVPDDIGDPDEAAMCDETLDKLDDAGNRYTFPSAAPHQYSYVKSDVYNIQTENKSHQWMGVTVHSDPNDNYIISCAHRYESRYLIIEDQIHDPPKQLVGKCVVLTQTFELENVYVPCLEKESGYESYGYCQMGASQALVNRTVVVGAPGLNNGRGGFVLFYDVIDIADEGRYPPKPRASVKDTFKDLAYNGYSSTVCILNKNYNVNIITGGPRGAYYKGIVTIYEYEQSSMKLIKKIELEGEQFGGYYGHSLFCDDLNGDGVPDIVVGAPWFTQYSSADTKPDIGRIYIYTGERDFYVKNIVDTIKIDGHTSDEAFGFSMAGAGDIDHDGYGDLFVGAPYYNNGEGRIYLYLGTKDGISTTASQIISPSQLGINVGLKGFGWSISSQKDVDSNSYNDVLIGSWKSNHAVLLRSIKIVDVDAQIKFNKTEIHPKEGDILAPDGTLVPGTHFQACFRYIGEEVPDTNNIISIKFKVDFDAGETIPRVHIIYGDTTSRHYTKTIDIDTTNTTFCTDSIALYYTTDSFNVNPIKAVMIANIVQASDLPFNKRAVLNQKYVNYAATIINIGYECPKETRVCSANMTLKIEPIFYEGKDLYPLVIGKVDVISISFVITNNGPDFAYGTTLQVKIPNDLRFIENTKCDIMNTTETNKYYTVACELQEPLQPKTSKSWNLQFNISHLEVPIKDNVTAKATVREPSVEIYADSAISVLIIDIENLADVKLRGGTSGKRVPFSNKFTITDKTYEKAISGYDGPLVIHTYEIYHVSESYNRHVENITIQIMWPEKFPNGAPLFPLKSLKYGIYPNGDNKTIHCNNTITTDNLGIFETFFLQTPEDKYPEINCLTNASLCTKLVCTIESLERGLRAKFALFSNIQEYVLNDFNKLIVTSSIKISSVQDGMRLPYKKSIQASATTTLYSSKFKRRHMLWIFIIAILIGLLVLAILIYMLRMKGFFIRFRPEPDPPYTYGYLVRYDQCY